MCRALGGLIVSNHFEWSTRQCCFDETGKLGRPTDQSQTLSCLLPGSYHSCRRYKQLLEKDKIVPEIIVKLGTNRRKAHDALNAKRKRNRSHGRISRK